MASCRTERAKADAGFATSAAMVISLGLAVMASAVTALAVADLKGAEADVVRARTEYRLDGLQLQAGYAVASDPKAVRLEWTLPSGRGQAHVLAESEAAKLSAQNLDALGPGVFQKLGVTDPADLRRRLQGLGAEGALGPALEAADASPLWKACARSLISPYGAATSPPKLRHSLPAPSGVISRIGEVWRIRVDADGWADDRIVRLTGNPKWIAAVIARRLYRHSGEGEACDRLGAL